MSEEASFKLCVGESFTVELATYLNHAPNRDAPQNATWATLFLMGRDSVAIQRDSPAPLIGSSQSPVLRLGFCNNEVRPRLEIVTRPENRVEELWLGDALPVGDGKPYQIAFTVDGQKQRVELFINSSSVITKTLLGQPVVCHLPSVVTGTKISKYTPMYHRIWRKVLTADELNSVAYRPIENQSWDIEYDFHELFSHVKKSSSGIIAQYAVMDINLLKSQKSPALEVACRLLDAVGVEVANPEDSDEVLPIAQATISEITQILKDLINKDSVDEPQIRDHFRYNPGAAFLLSPEHSKMWREEGIQGHGIIDYVFEVGKRIVVQEIESPRAKIFTGKNELTAASHHAIDQVENWKKGITKLPAIARSKYGTDNANSFAGEVVIGRSCELSNDKRKQRWDQWGEKGISLYTWDDIVDRGRQLANRFGNPSVTPSEWS